jgi:predicted XRE-type DNA-binding protein
MKRTAKQAFDHSGSSFDSFLDEEGIREEVEAVAIKRVLAWELSQEMKRQRKTKQTMARELHTSRSQLDRLLDPNNAAVSLETMHRAAQVLGKSLTIRISDRKGPSQSPIAGQTNKASAPKTRRG